MPPSPSPAKIIEIKPLFQAEPKVYPRWVTGVFQRWRWFFVALTQLAFYGLCWLPWNGRQAVLFNLEAHRFYLFDLILWPQDVIYLAVILVLSALALFLFTTVAGRVWCGYTCPQTVYTSIFLWIEKITEGDRPQRMKLDAEPWSTRKLARKSVKHVAWATLSLWTGLTFVGYFTPIRDLVQESLSFSLGGWDAFWVVFYGAATYGNAGFLREQMCKYICPYARFQSVMFDSDTLIIAYDKERGEPRGGRSRKVDPRAKGLGDCVDCGICVQVCPTGIDIRNGLQNECIGCAACVDACDQVMDKMDYPRGLIRYSTDNAVTQHFTRRETVRRALRPRVLIYSAVLLSLVAATAWSLATRVPLKADLSRDRAALAREVSDGAIENVFRLQVTNASEQARTYAVTVEGIEGIHLEGNNQLHVAAASIGAATLAVRAPSGELAAGAHPIRFEITAVDDPSITVKETAKFWMPTD
jgi:cytochrome c oxidase accessory protein FixG